MVWRSSHWLSITVGNAGSVARGLESQRHRTAQKTQRVRGRGPCGGRPVLALFPHTCMLRRPLDKSGWKGRRRLKPVAAANRAADLRSSHRAGGILGLFPHNAYTCERGSGVVPHRRRDNGVAGSFPLYRWMGAARGFVLHGRVRSSEGVTQLNAIRPCGGFVFACAA